MVGNRRPTPKQSKKSGLKIVSPVTTLALQSNQIKTVAKVPAPNTKPWNRFFRHFFRLPFFNYFLPIFFLVFIFDPPLPPPSRCTTTTSTGNPFPPMGEESPRETSSMPSNILSEISTRLRRTLLLLLVTSAPDGHGCTLTSTGTSM